MSSTDESTTVADIPSPTKSECQDEQKQVDESTLHSLSESPKSNLNGSASISASKQVLDRLMNLTLQNSPEEPTPSPSDDSPSNKNAVPDDEINPPTSNNPEESHVSPQGSPIKTTPTKSPSKSPAKSQDSKTKTQSDIPRRQIIRKWTTPPQLIQTQIRLLTNQPKFPSEETTQNDLKYLNPTPLQDYPSAFPPVEVIPANMVDIKTLCLHIGDYLMEKFLLCRTITPAVEVDAAVETIVEEPRGKRAARLQLFNFSAPEPKVNFNIVLPSGTFLILKNPLLCVGPKGDLALRCDDPSQIEFISRKATFSMFPDAGWTIKFPILKHEDIKIPNDNMWASFPPNNEGYRDALRRIADIALIKERYIDAIRWYTMSLDYNTADLKYLQDVLSSRSACFFSIRCFNRAIQDIDKVLAINPTHVEAISRKTHALFGLKKYPEAHDFIFQVLYTKPALKTHESLQELCTTAKFFGTPRSYDSFEVDMSKLLNITPTTERVDEIPNYMGPADVANIEGKGRGLVAIEDINIGQLIVSSKAFAVSKCVSQGMEDLTESFKTKYTKAKTALIGQIAYQLHFEPQSGNELYILHAGQELGFLPLHNPLNRVVDMNRISKILRLNSFGVGPAFLFNCSRPESLQKFPSLHITPSFANHSCSDANTQWSLYGEVLILRAIKPIKKHEEILVSYVEPQVSYECRCDLLSIHDFACSCRLCKLDQEDTTNGKSTARAENFQKILSLVRQFEHEKSNKTLMDEALHCVLTLESLRTSSPKLNACMGSKAILCVLTNLFRSGKVDQILRLFHKIYSINKEVGEIAEAIATAKRIAQYHVVMGDINALKAWMEVLRKDLIAAFGSVQGFSTLGNQMILDLEELGIKIR